MRKESKKFLRDYLNANSPTGFETAGQKIWLEYMKQYIDEYEVDVYGSVVGVINPGQKYKVVIEAHADEIAWFVNYIDEKGYIYVIRNGGSDHQIAPSMRVHLHTPKGKVDGIFGWPAIHIRNKDREPTPSLANLTIDVGAANKKEVLAMGIDVGTVVTFDAEMMELNKKYVVARAIDNRGGGFMIAEVARLLKENKIKLPYTLYVVKSSIIYVFLSNRFLPTTADNAAALISLIFFFFSCCSLHSCNFRFLCSITNLSCFSVFLLLLLLLLLLLAC